MSVRADSETLRAIPIFRDCDTVALQILAFAAERQAFSAGEDIIVQGKKARAAFLILSGQATVKDGQTEVGTAEPGAFLGEIAMVRAGPYAINATAVVAVETARVTHELFVRVAKEYPEFGQKVLQNLGDRLDSRMRELEGIRVMLAKSRNFADLS